MTNDNAYPPAQGNLCWGVWTRVEKGQYKINHIGWVFDANGGYFGRFDFEATLVLNDHGDGINPPGVPMLATTSPTPVIFSP